MTIEFEKEPRIRGIYQKVKFRFENMVIRRGWSYESQSIEDDITDYDLAVLVWSERRQEWIAPSAKLRAAIMRINVDKEMWGELVMKRRANEQDYADYLYESARDRRLGI